jgi:hypothetical protein
MGKSSGNIRTKKNGGIGRDGGGDYSKPITGKESIANIADTQLRREIQQGISKYESRLGVRQTNVQLANLDGAVGVHVTSGGKSEGVYLDKKSFKKASVEDVNVMKRNAYKAKFLTETNKPVQHTIVHELGHATWNKYLTSPAAVKARPVIEARYKQFLKEYEAGKAKGYGKYSTSNVNEFWAEATTKAVLGKPDKYTRFVKETIKKYKL